MMGNIFGIMKGVSSIMGIPFFNKRGDNANKGIYLIIKIEWFILNFKLMHIL